MLGLARTEEPYRTVLFETILERGRARSAASLIGAYQDLPVQWQELLIAHAEHLDGPLRLAAKSQDSQTRLNALALIGCGGCAHLGDLVVTLLGDRSAEISRQAGATLVELAELFTHVRPAIESPGQLVPPADQQRQTNRRGVFQRALAAAVGNYAEHRHSQAVLAAMMLVPASNEDFWRKHFQPGRPVGDTVKTLLSSSDRVELANFMVSALREPHLRAAAARAISGLRRLDFIRALARAFDDWDDHRTRTGLKLVRRPQWLNRQVLPAEQLDDDDQLRLVRFIAALGAKADLIGNYLSRMLDNSSQQVALEIVENLAALDNSPAGEHFQRTLNSPYESVALAGLGELIRRHVPGLMGILIHQLGSVHEQVRDLAAQQCQGMAFDSYWKNFDNLSAQQRRSAGNAVFKIDPQAPNRWCKYARDASPEYRLRAVRIARALDQVDRYGENITRLTADRDAVVRSCAVAALGQIRREDSQFCNRRVIAALNDPDSRVRANAVEAVERRNIRTADDLIDRLTHSNNNRVRANAIKAQLTWKVESARGAIRDMLHDQRPRHRRSARWLWEQLPPTAATSAEGEETPAETTNDLKREYAHAPAG